MLEIRRLEAGYGETQVLHGLDLAVGAGRVLAVLGRNGAGKSTMLKAVMGLVKSSGGSIAFDGGLINGRKPFAIAGLGIAYVPETRDIFPSLTVRENLDIAARHNGGGASGWTVERVLDFFPALKGRLGNGGNELSGGEQQMLAIGRALAMNPRLLLLDEPTEGLAPIIIRQIHDKLSELRSEGMTMVLVEQNFGFATSLADDVAVIGRGRTVWSGPPDAIRGDKALQSRWLGV
jgi:branched-chain amino acid transport system ATP-binding protein